MTDARARSSRACSSEMSSSGWKPHSGASFASAAWTSTRGSPERTASGCGSAGGSPGRTPRRRAGPRPSRRARARRGPRCRRRGSGARRPPCRARRSRSRRRRRPRGRTGPRSWPRTAAVCRSRRPRRKSSPIFNGSSRVDARRVEESPPRLRAIFFRPANELAELVRRGEAPPASSSRQRRRIEALDARSTPSSTSTPRARSPRPTRSARGRAPVRRRPIAIKDNQPVEGAPDLRPRFLRDHLRPPAPTSSAGCATPAS